MTTEQPDLKFGEAAKIISAEWKALTDDERRPYQEMAQKAKENAQAAEAAQDAGVDSGGAGSAADSADSKPVVGKKVEVNILAEGADGTSEMKVTVRRSMALKRLMQAWCDHHELPLEEADFLLGSRVLKYEDTLDSLGCGDNVEVKAVPKGDTGDASIAAVAVTAASAADMATPKAKAVAKPPRSARSARGRGANRGKRKSRGKGDKSSEDSLEPEESEPKTDAAPRRSKRLQDSEQVFPNATLVHHLPTPPRKEKEGVPGEVSKRMSFREYLQFDREQEKMRNHARLARQKRKFVNGDSSDEELHMALALSLSESQDAQREDSDSQRLRDPELADEISPAAA